MSSESTLSLRDRQAAETRDSILDAAMELLSGDGDANFSHESIAARAQVGARTVYRHFPDRDALLQALWVKLRARTRTRFPQQTDAIVPFARNAFREFDRNEPLVRAVLTSAAGTAVRDRGGVEGRTAFEESLAPLLEDASPAERRRAIAIFVAVYSAPFWQLLRDRGGLSGQAAQDAVAWTLDTLIEGLRTQTSTKNNQPKGEAK